MGKVALVTGGSRGIGLGIAEALAASGWDLAINGVREPSATADAVAQLSRHGHQVAYVQADVSLPDDRQKLLAEVRGTFGRLDALVNNAGVAPQERADILDASLESFRRVMTINLEGPYFLTQLAANWMIQQRQADAGFGGYIVNVSSISAEVASVSRGEYCISKAGVSMASKLWAVRLAEFGINVYEVRPGLIRTDMTASVQAKYDALIAEGLVPQGRWGSPEDIGKAVAMLVRGDVAYATGAVLTLDGGMTLSRL